GHSKSNLLCPRHPKKVSYSSSSSSGSTFPVSFSINHGFRQEYLPANNQPPYVATLMSTPTSSVAVAQSLHQQRKNFQLMRAYELPLQSPPLEQVSPTPQGDRLPRDFPHDLSAQHETRALSAQVRMREDARIRQQHSRDTLSSEAQAHRLAIDRARAQNRRNQSVSRESHDHQLAADRAHVRNRRNQSRASLAQSKLQFHQFLLERELNFDFGAVETQKPVFLESMAKSLGFEFLLESVCAICELLFPKCELESCQLDNTLIENMKRSLIIDPTIVEDIPEFIRAYYNVSDIHADLGSMFLQRKGFSVSDLSTSVTLCTPCKSVIFNKKRKTPPEESIANGNWIGEIEQKFKSMSSVDKLSVALVVPGFVLKSLVADKEKKTLNSHFYALLNSRPFIQIIPSDASDSSRITLCGAFTSAQKAATLSREKWNAPLCRDFVDTYGGQNVFLRDHPNYIQPAENSDAQSIFVDRTDSSSNPVPERIVNMMSFGSTSYNSGASTDEIDTATELYNSTRNYYVYEQGREPSPIVSEDFAAFHSANYSKSRDLSDAPFMFVHLLPGGCGGPNEPNRPIKMSHHRWFCRMLKVHHRGPQMDRFFAAWGQSYSIIAKDSLRECLNYARVVENCRKHGIQKPAAPDVVKDLMDIEFGVQNGAAAYPGSNESVRNARHILLSFGWHSGQHFLFTTISPATDGTYIISIQNGIISQEEAAVFRVPNHLPSKKERRAQASKNPYACALYAYRILKAYLSCCLGWDLATGVPKTSGGLWGFPKWWHASAEAQQLHDIHWHLVQSFYGIPATTRQMRECLDNPGFMERFLAFLDTTVETDPFQATYTPTDDIPSPCPMPDCNGNVEAIPIAQEAFRRGRVGQPPVPTSQCASCSKLYAHSQLMTQRVRQFAAENNVDISPGAVDHFRCSPPLSAYDPSNPEHVCLLAMVLLDVQFHWAEHTGGCFKITSRTPLAIICRFIKPHMANLLKTCIDKDTGIIEWFRPIGNEYLNLCNVHLSFLLRFNLDEQSQVNGEFRRVSVYTCKYNTKYLSQDELLCMRIGQYTSAIESVLDDPSNSNLSVADLSGKILNKILYKITNPVGMPLTLLCIIIINGSLYVRSPEPIYWNAKQFYACYRQFDSPAGESNIFGPTQLAHPVEAEHIASNSSDSSDSNDSSNLNPESHDEFLEFSFYSSTIMSSAPPPANASMTAEQASLANEEENIITINPAIDFWYRPASLKSMCFRDILETQHLVRGSHKSKEMLPPHPFPAKRHWVDNRRPCRLVIRGQQIPYLEKPSITWEEKEFYYWIFLFLYKPHQNASELLYGQQSYQAAYQEFLVDESMAEFVRQARRHEDFNRNHYENCYAEKDPNYEADETRICREHQLNDPTINNQPAHSNEVENLLDLQFDILDDDIGFHFLSEQEEDESLLQSLPQGMKAIDINFSLLSGMPTFPQMPAFTNMDDYKKRLQDPGDMEASGLEGTTMFLQWNRENKILLLQECCTPVPWVDSSHLGPPDISQLQQFASISEISIAYRLDFFQHLAFQEVARHLMYSFITDIQYAGKLQIPLPHLALKPQLISFLGGEAGHGKSECIISLLTFVRLWGRRDTVEVLAPTNLTAMHLGGLTMHASRGLDIFKRKLALSAPSQKRIENAYLTVLEEASMMEQGDLGLADEVTRTIMGNDTVWGGKHVWMAADFLQFEPPTGPYIFKPLEGQDKPHASAPKALQLVNSINHSVFLTKNWRQKDDPPFAALLSRTHWGVNTSDDINLLNTRFVGSPTLEKAICGTPDIEFFAPIATPINVRRCALNRHILHRTASTNHQLIYQINAYSTKVTVRNQFKRLQHLDDDYTDKTPFLLSFVLGSPVMCTKKLRDSQFFSKGVIAFVVGYEADTSCGSDDAALFITSTVNNITFKRFRLQPLLLYLKIRGCSNVLVDGFPPGILGIPPWKGPIMTNIGGHGSLVKYPKKENRLWQPVCIQFPIILSYACTPEKMQGVTLKNHLIVTPLSRKGMKPQTLYVTLSRVKTLIALYLTERVTRQYLTKFRPLKHFVRKTLDLIQKIELPSYTPAHIMNSFDEWRSTQIRYAHQALHLS
ncbi:hypothetical protein BDR26DRAFT_993338, partial [Obelidium mucronatum]